MQKPAAWLMICCGAAILAAVSYGAIAITELLGMSRYGGEGIVALTALAMSTMFIAMGFHGLIKRRIRISSRAAA